MLSLHPSLPKPCLRPSPRTATHSAFLLSEADRGEERCRTPTSPKAAKSQNGSWPLKKGDTATLHCAIACEGKKLILGKNFLARIPLEGLIEEIAVFSTQRDRVAAIEKNHFCRYD